MDKQDRAAMYVFTDFRQKAQSTEGMTSEKEFYNLCYWEQHLSEENCYTGLVPTSVFEGNSAWWELKDLAIHVNLEIFNAKSLIQVSVQLPMHPTFSKSISRSSGKVIDGISQSSLTVDLDCQVNEIQNHHGNQFFSASVRDYLYYVI